MIKHRILQNIAPFLLISACVHGRDPQPMNSKFNIGQDIITSRGYGLFNVNNPYIILRDEPAIISSSYSFSYGITRSIGFTFTLPFVLKQKIDNYCSRGLSDVSCIAQWHFLRTEDQLLLLKTGIQLPTGDSNARPPLGSGSFNPSLSLEAFHSSDRFFASIICEGTITPTRKHKKAGNSIEYDITLGPKWPLGRNRYAKIYTFLELQGFYASASKFNGKQVPNTGRHVVLFGPILSYDIDRYQYLLRIQFPVANHRLGKQPQLEYLISLSFQCDL